jgi:tRNA (cytidine56-2'-O)-methyltransferase
VIKEYRDKGWSIIHLTMYGLRFEKEIPKIRKKENVLLVFGGEKVPMEIYHDSDFNIGVTNQPHSEVAAIAIFLDGYFQGKQYSKRFTGGKKIIPQKCGKRFA